MMARYRTPHLRRRPATIFPRRRFLLVCEGKNTGPQYFRTVRAQYPRALLQIETIGGAGDPWNIAEMAIRKAKNLGIAKRSRKKLDSFEENDEVWAIFDRDEHDRFFDAVNKCEGYGIGVARSNPCFEVWLILHIEDFERPGGRSSAQARLRTICSDYDRRRKIINCAPLLDKIEIAEARAKQQLRNRQNEGNPYGAPSTTVYELTQRIREAAGITV